MQRLLFAALAVTALTVSCELLPTTASIVLLLPHTPQLWAEAWGPARYHVSWRSVMGEHMLPDSVAADGRAVIHVPRLPPVAVRAVAFWPEGGPALADGEQLAIAGAVWSASSSADGPRHLALTFAGGPVANVAWRLLEAGVDARSMSFARLDAEVAERLPDDPWSLDVDRVVAAFAARAMRATYVREVERRSVELDVPSGSWLSASPFVAAATPATGWPPLAAGLTVFYSADGRRRIIDVDPHRRGWQAWSIE